MANQPTNAQRADPIRDRFFVPLEAIDNVSNWLFFFTAFLSFLALLFDAKADPEGYNYVQTVFIATALLLFVVGQAAKLYFWPRSERPRRQDFLSYGLGVNLTHIRTTGYYNNNETDPIRRIGAAVLENTLFTKTIIRKMLIRTRLLTLGYILGWIIALSTRTTDLGWIAQVIFSEQLVSRYLRMEWLRSKTENIHEGLIAIFRSGSTPTAMQPYVWEAFSEYEAIKTNAGILASKKIFTELNSTLSDEWEKIKQSANIL
jgi:hypothetical protein